MPILPLINKINGHFKKYFSQPISILLTYVELAIISNFENDVDRILARH